MIERINQSRGHQDQRTQGEELGEVLASGWGVKSVGTAKGSKLKWHLTFRYQSLTLGDEIQINEKHAWTANEGAGSFGLESFCPDFWGAPSDQLILPGLLKLKLAVRSIRSTYTELTSSLWRKCTFWDTWRGLHWLSFWLWFRSWSQQFLSLPRI